jgi:hypothetical protein
MSNSHQACGGKRAVQVLLSADSSEGALRSRFRHCNFKRYHNLIDGMFFLCPRSAHGSQLGQFPIDSFDCVRSGGRRDWQQVRAELKALCRKQYVAACPQCTGGGESIKTAVQLPAPRPKVCQVEA